MRGVDLVPFRDVVLWYSCPQNLALFAGWVARAGTLIFREEPDLRLSMTIDLTPSLQQGSLDPAGPTKQPRGPLRSAVWERPRRDTARGGFRLFIEKRWTVLETSRISLNGQTGMSRSGLDRSL